MILTTVVLTFCGLFQPFHAASWGSHADARGPYLIPGPDNNLRETLNNARCAKLHNNHGPAGWRQRWRPINTANPTDFWSTPVGPRSTFATTPDESPEDLWTFLGGEVQLFVSYTSTEGTRKATFASTRCVVFTPAFFSGLEVSSRTRAPMGVEVARDPGTGRALVVAAPRRISEELDFLGREWTPIALGMTPAVPGTVVRDDAWKEREFAEGPERWRAATFTDETQIGRDLRMWTRSARPEYRIVDGSEVSVEEWRRGLPTRLYNEAQCRSLLSYEEDQQRPGVETEPLVGVSGIFEGDKLCDMEMSIWVALYQIGAERRRSPSALLQPLSTAEGVLLVAIPAIWEIFTAMALFFVRMSRGTLGRGSRKRVAGWVFLEAVSVLVAIGELTLLSVSTVQQLQWQPCWIGRWSGTKALLDNGTDITFQGDRGEILSVVTDTLAVECSEDPGTDAKWAVTIGVVLVFHLGLLVLECAYLSVPGFRNALQKRVAYVLALSVKPGGAVQGGEDAFAVDDNDVPMGTPNRRYPGAVSHRSREVRVDERERDVAPEGKSFLGRLRDVFSTSWRRRSQFTDDGVGIGQSP